MDPKKQGKDLMEIIAKSDWETLIDLSAKHKNKKDPFSFKDVVKGLSEENFDSIWEVLSKLVIELTETLYSPNLQVNKENSLKKKCLETTPLVQAVIDLAFEILNLSLPISKDLLHMIVFLNRSISEIPSNMDGVKNSIALLCEKMFQLNYLCQDQELITYNTVIYLLKRSTSKKALRKDVKRLYAMHTLIPKIIGMKEVDSNEVWNLFKQCVISSVYLSVAEGQKIISMILTLDVDHVYEAIKKRFSSCTLTQGKSYGTIFFEAWSHAVKINSEALKNQLEVSCLQDIVMLAVQGRQKSLVLVLRKLLSQFHCQKKEIHVSKMLYFMYQPILWRFLKNPDGLIRANTAQLFLDVFPLEDPDVKIVTTDLELNDQMLMIKDLLIDDFPIVRCATVIGLCIAMSINWELFPEDMIKTYFKIIVNDLSCDSSSADVRCAVVQGFKVLLDNPLTVPTLQGILPKIKSLFHDISDSVRVAFCQLLLQVKKICGIRYFDIVPIDHLMARLEEDKVIAKPLVNLIHNSYFPKSDGPDVWVARCTEMVKTDRGASRVFFQFAPNFIGLESTAKFMVQAVKSIHFVVKSKMSRQKICVLSSPSNKENFHVMNDSAAIEDVVGLNDPNVVSGLLDAVSIMWLSSLNDLGKPENKGTLKMIVAKLAKCLGDLALYYKDTTVWESVYYLSSFMPSQTVPSLASLCFLRLQTIPADSTSDDYITLLECLCNHGEASSVINLMKDWIQAAFSVPLAEPSAKKRKCKSKEPQFSPKPLLAVQMLNAMLEHRSCQKVLLAKNPEDLKEILPFIDDLKRKVEMGHKKLLSSSDIEFLTALHFTLLKVSVLLESEEKFCSVKYVEDIILWMQDKILKMAEPEKTNNSRPNTKTTKYKTSVAFENLVQNLLKDMFTILIDMTLLGIMNLKSGRFIKFGVKVLNSSFGSKVLVYFCKLLLRHASFGLHLLLKDPESQTNILRCLPDCFNKVYQCLSDEDFLKSVPSQDFKEIQFSIASTLLLVQQENCIKEIASDVNVITTKNILNSVFKDMETWENIEKECDPFEKITFSKSATFLLSTICVKPKLILYFLQQLQKYVAKIGKDMQTWVACYVIVMNIWEMKNMSKNISKEMRSLVSKMEEILVKNHVAKIDTGLLSKKKSLSPESESMDTPSDKEDMLSFTDHCRFEFKKLKDLVHQKTGDT